MRRVFADTYFFIALVNERDRAHPRGVEFATSERASLVTTAWIMTELADGLAKTPNRGLFSTILAETEQEASNILVPASNDLFRQGIERYEQRPDESWSLTDCISFVVMEEHGLSEALTADRHFEQAGFVPLLA